MRRRRLASTGLVLAAALAAPQAAGAVTGPPSQDFGAVRIGTPASAPVALVAEYAPPAPGEPIGTATIAGPDAADFAIASDGCAPGPVPAGCRIDVTFAPAAAGLRTATLHVPGATAALDIPLRGVGFATGPRLAVAPALDFGAVRLGSATVPAPITVTNTGDLPAAIRAVALTGSGDFSQTSDCAGATLEPAESCTVQARFAPSIVGRAPATLHILSDAQAPVDVALAGTGVVVVSGVAGVEVLATDWSPFQIVSAKGTRRRIVLRLYSSLPARVVVTVEGTATRLTERVGAGFSRAVVTRRFAAGRRYRLVVVGLPVRGITNPRRHVLHRVVRIPH